MYLLFSNSNNPYFNLATEEYLFKNFNEDFIFVYTNYDSVIIGKHQIPYKEVDFKFVNTNNIAICRRFSGGGTVFHDSQNLNFAFVCKNKNNEINVDFNLFTQPIIAFLKSLSLNAYKNSRNSIIIDEKKVSGNAEHVNSKRILHHGTLLFNSNLNNLNSSFKNDPSRFIDKSVASVSSSVNNILNFLVEKIDFNDFTNLFCSFMKDYYNCQKFEFSDVDIQNINRLKLEKYQTDYWNFMYSPNYFFSGEFIYDSKKYFFSFEVIKGFIKKFDYQPYNIDIENNFKTQVLGLPHLYNEINENIRLKFHTLDEKLKFIYQLF